MSRFQNKFALLLGAVAVCSLVQGSALDARNCDIDKADMEKLQHGEVVIGQRDEGATRYVSGSVIIDQPPDRVWPIMANPYEFKGKIEPRMKKVEIMIDKPDLSVMKVSLDMTLLFPNFHYVVESKYVENEKIEFKRVGGTLKDFKGTWTMVPTADGNKTELTYDLFIDPGFYVPQWVIREGVKGELPRTLQALRKRVMAVCNDKEQPEARNIMASSGAHHTIGAASKTSSI